MTALEGTTVRETPAPVLARISTEVLSPIPLLAIVSLGIVVASNVTVWSAIVHSAVALTFGSVIPLAFILVGVRRGRLTDRHIVAVRHQRHLPLVVSLTSVAIGAFCLLASGAPRGLVTLFLTAALVLLPSMVITVWWQISIHVAVAAAVSVLVTVWITWLAITAVAVLLVAWSRLRLGAHTLAQVLAGSLLGAAVGMVVSLLVTGD